MLTTLTDLLTEYKDATKDPTTENVNRGKRYINRALRKYIGMDAWVYREKTRTTSTVASQKFYDLPADYGKYVASGVTVDNEVYPMELVYTRDEWNRIQSGNNTTTGDEAQYIWIDRENNQYGIFPTPESADNDIEFSYLARDRELTLEDYTTGTISITTETKAVTGSGTTFTSSMVGAYIELDGEGYRISAVGGATSLTLENNYQGSTLSGATYRIGDASLMPDNCEDLPWIYATYMYYLKTRDRQIASDYKQELDSLVQIMLDEERGESASNIYFKRKYRVGNANEDPTVTISSA